MDVNDTKNTPPPPVAIISTGCFFPKASSAKAYWHLLYHGKDAIADVPPTHWSVSDYYDEDPRKPDHVYCRRGGFLSPIPFDPTAFGIPPSNLEATDSSQILGLLAARTALEQAGYGENTDFDRDRTAVILGVTGTQELVIPLSSRLGWPKWKEALEWAGVDAEKRQAVMTRLSDDYVAWQENSFPGLLGNVVAGRICNRLDLGGTNCVVDAACASSMSAINLALMELYAGKSRMVVTGGVDTLNDIFMHMCFARTQILSPTGDARPFSKDADGTVLGEGVGILIMKRLADAEADGDRILAVLKGIGSSSDGKSQSIYAPRAEGQLKALREAYTSAAIAPNTVNLIEAHGTGTRVGDKIEVQALKKLFGDQQAATCALGSVKSMIGHTKAAAGAAGLIKTVMALQNRTLPPTLKADEPDPDLDLGNSPFYLNTRSTPWFRSNNTPRRAGVSAFGFGGSNFHVVLEEYTAQPAEVAWDGSIEILGLGANSRASLRKAFHRMKTDVADCPAELLPHLARESRASFQAEAPFRLLMVLNRTEDTNGPRWNTETVFEETAQAFEKEADSLSWQTASSFFGSGDHPGRLAFLFPGQGSQYIHMGRDLVSWFPEAMETLESAAVQFSGHKPLTDYIYPRPVEPTSAREQDEALRHTAVAQPAIGGVSVAMEKILRRFGLTPEATCGHSYGELTALYGAGWIDEATLHTLSTLRGRHMAEAGGSPGEPNGAMLAVKAPLESLDRLLEKESLDVVLANRNSPNQGILSGDTESIAKAEAVCKDHKFRTVRLPVSAAFHSALVEGAREPFAEALESIDFQPNSDTMVYSNTTGGPYPTNREAIRALLGEHLRNPVNFIGEIENLYQDQFRIFIEVGPKTVLTGLVRAILKGRDFHALSVDASSGKKFGVADLARLLCQLAALGSPINWDEWESQETPPHPMKMRIPITGANYRGATSPSNTKPSDGAPPRAGKDAPRPPGGTARPGKPSGRILPEALSSASETMAFDNPAVAAPRDPNPIAVSPSVNKPNHAVLQALQVVQQGLESLQSLQAQTVEAHQKFLDTQQQAGRTLQEMIESSRRFAEAALGGNFAGPHETVAATSTAPSTDPTTPAASSRALQSPAAPSGRTDPDIESSGRQPDQVSLPPVEKSDNPDHARVAQTLLAVVSELTGYPEDMLGMDMNIESDLGIDSIKRVEILSKLEEKLSDLPPVTPDIISEFQTLGEVAAYLAGSVPGQLPHGAPHPADHPSPPRSDEAPNTVTTALIDVVSELTGYPSDMLSLDMDVEADLGIDSIKRVEILSALEDRMADFPAIAPDEMAGLKTLGQIAARLGDTGAGFEPGTAAPSDPQASPAAKGSEETIRDTLFAVVSDLTGYPVDMLAGHMDIEADLGIDSIKRVEILSAMEDRLPVSPAIAPDDMAELKTLDEIAAKLDGIDGSSRRDAAASAPPAPTATIPLSTPASEDHPRQISRRELTAVVTPREPAPRISLPRDRKIFITTDKAGLSHALADQLSAGGLHTVQISADILKHRKQLPEAAGLIILADTDYPETHTATHLKSFLTDAFELVRHLGPSLQESARDGGAILATVSRMDGSFGLDGLNGSHPYQGGLAGLTKTAAIEWPDVTCRALDIDAHWQDNPAIAKEVVEELLYPPAGTPVEIGWRHHRRLTLDLTPAPVPAQPQHDLDLEDGDVVVISGGAKGVTAAAAEAIGCRKAVKLILLGRSPMPSEEPEWLAPLTDEGEIKKAIIAHDFPAATPTPVSVQKAYQRYCSNREISRNLERIAATGAEVRYVSLDVRDAGKVRALMNDVRLVHGPIKALIHGAGVLRDKRITDKTLDEFQLVFSTKVEGLENLLEALQDDPVRHIILFSSVAARFGNIGQVDYAIANEVLNKVAAAELRRRKDCKVRAINWGPWDGGMVNASLRKSFIDRDIALIPMDQGADAFIAEMAMDPVDTAEVVIGSELAAALTPDQPTPAQHPVSSDSKMGSRLGTTYISELSLERYPILDHHRLDGKPVVPFALMAEWFGHGALHNNPGMKLAGIDDMRLLKGIVLGERQRPIRVMAAPAKANGSGISVSLELRDGVEAGAEVIHSKATAILVDQVAPPPPYEIPVNLVKSNYRRDVSQIYDDILFHGRALQGIRIVHACNASGMLAELNTAPAPDTWIQKPPRNRWIADPLVLDCAFQMASLWCYEETGRVSLPSYSASYRQFCRRFPDEAIQAVLTVQTVSRHKLVGDFTFLDREGTMLAHIVGYEAVMEDRLLQAFKPERFATGR